MGLKMAGADSPQGWNNPRPDRGELSSASFIFRLAEALSQEIGNRKSWKKSNPEGGCNPPVASLCLFLSQSALLIEYDSM